jgi:hypothetical protein
VPLKSNLISKGLLFKGFLLSNASVIFFPSMLPLPPITVMLFTCSSLMVKLLPLRVAVAVSSASTRAILMVF